MAEKRYRLPQTTDAAPKGKRTRRRAIVLFLACIVPIFVVFTFGGAWIAEQFSDDYYIIGSSIGMTCSFIVSLFIRQRYFPEVTPPKQ